MEEDFWIISGKRQQRYRAKKIICISCKKELLVFKNRKHCGYCQSCNAKRINPKVANDEIFLEEGKSRRRANKIQCLRCKKELFVRKDRQHCGLCHSCNAAKRGHEGNFIDGYTRYRQRMLKFSLKICFCCKCDDEKKIIVHHVDGNRKNGKMENLVILCQSCHRLIHNEMRKGIFHEKAIENIKNIKSQKNQNK